MNNYQNMIDNFWLNNYTFMCSCLFTAFLCGMNIIFELRGGNFSMANQPKKYKKFVATAATATLVASAIVPAALAAEFKDVTGNDHEVAINALAEQGIIKGFTDGTFKPNQTVTRGQVVKLLGRWLETLGEEVPADWKSEQRFTDVATSNQDEELVKYAALTKDAGVFAGSGGNLNAAQTMTRQQMALVLVRAIKEIGGVDLVAEYREKGHVTEISDLDKAHGAEQRNAIVALEYAGITKVSVFNPNNSITRGQFASFLYRTINNILEASVADVTSIKAINNTTVEVTFENEVDDIKALDFAIDGLEIKNAAVKQTNKKVVVLTTEAQEADKEYTVSLNDDKIGTFKGIGAVVPTSIKLLTTNTQGKVGNQVTLTADVGVKAAGIPVTFNVDAPTGSLNKDAVVEVFTNAEGIASYSYTQYAPDADDVTVYPTGAPQLRAFGTVYWGVDNILTIEEVTTGNVLANGVKKTYKVTFKDPKTGAALSNRALNVSFVENTNVAFNAISKATVTNPTTGVTVTPYQATTGYSEELKVTTDSNGQATFVVSGTNTAVTPYVFVDGSSSVLGVTTVTGTNGVTTPTTANKKWEATELTATAAQVKFEGAQLSNQITVERAGEEEAAAVYGTKLNGREYKVKVLDKDGKPYANGLVNIALDEVIDRNISTNSNAKFANVTDSTALTNLNASGQQGKIKLDSKGEATVLLYGAKGEVGTPVVWIDQNTAQNNQTGVLEDGEPFFKAPISNFQFERVIGAEFKVEGKTTNQSVSSDGIANYTFALTNQSGKALERLQGKLTYEIRNTSGQPIVVKTPVAYTTQGNVTDTLFRIEEYGSLTITATVGNTDAAAITVETAPIGQAGSVLVTPTFVTAPAFDASADNGITTDVRDFNKYVTATGLTATFGSASIVPNIYTDLIDLASIDTTKKTIKFEGKATPVKYAGETGKTYKYYGIGSTPIATAENFITELQSSPQKVRVTYQVIDDVVSFYIINTAVTPGTGTGTTNAVVTALNNAATQADKKAIVVANYRELSDAQANAFATALQTLGGTQAITLTSLQAAYDTLFVSVKSAVAFDTNADGIADQIKITFKENVVAAEKTILDGALAKFTLDNGTITGPSTQATAGDDTLIYTVTGATGLSLGNLKAVASTTADLATTPAQWLVGSTTALATATALTPLAAGTIDGGTVTRTPGNNAAAASFTIVASGNASAGGTVTLGFRADDVNGGTAVLVETTAISGDTPALIGAALKAKLDTPAFAAITDKYTVSLNAGTGALTFTSKTAGAVTNAPTASISGVASNSGLSAVVAGSNATAETNVFTFTGAVTAAGKVTVKVGDMEVDTLVATSDTATLVAGKVYDKLRATSAITDKFTISIDGAKITITNNTLGSTPNTTVTVTP